MAATRSAGGGVARARCRRPAGTAMPRRRTGPRRRTCSRMSTRLTDVAAIVAARARFVERPVYRSGRGPSGAATRPPRPCSTTSPNGCRRVVKTAARRSAAHRREHPGRAARSAPRAARGRRRAAGGQGLRRARARQGARRRKSSASLTPGPGADRRRAARAHRADGRRRGAARSSRRTPPAVILLAGLQGAGKTTTAGKLARLLREREAQEGAAGVSADVYRPAAIEQLQTLAAQVGVDFFPSDADQKPVDIARAARRLGAPPLSRRADRRHRRAGSRSTRR